MHMGHSPVKINSQSHRQMSQCLWPITLSESLSCTLACADGLNVCIAQLYINYYLCNVHTKSYHQTCTHQHRRPLDVYIHHHCTFLLQDIRSRSKIKGLCAASNTMTVLHHRLRPKHLTWVLSQWLWQSKTVRHSLSWNHRTGVISFSFTTWREHSTMLKVGLYKSKHRNSPLKWSVEQGLDPVDNQGLVKFSTVSFDTGDSMFHVVVARFGCGHVWLVWDLIGQYVFKLLWLVYR